MKRNIILAFCLSALILAFCSPGKNKKTEQQTQFEALQDTIAPKAKATEERYQKMQTDQLITELESAALKGQETFNSPAFREIIKRKEAGQPLYNSIKDTTRKEFFKLMALKKIDQNLYSSVKSNFALAILADALDKSETFNGWGMPDHYWESSAKAIIEYGRIARPYLVNLLDNKRAAPVWGSEEAAEYEKYKYRVCDYALALLYAIDKNDKQILPVVTEERDRMIGEYKKSFK